MAALLPVSLHKMFVQWVTMHAQKQEEQQMYKKSNKCIRCMAIQLRLLPTVLGCSGAGLHMIEI